MKSSIHELHPSLVLAACSVEMDQRVHVERETNIDKRRENLHQPSGQRGPCATPKLDSATSNGKQTPPDGHNIRPAKPHTNSCMLSRGNENCSSLDEPKRFERKSKRDSIERYAPANHSTAPKGAHGKRCSGCEF